MKWLFPILFCLISYTGVSCSCADNWINLTSPLKNTIYENQVFTFRAGGECQNTLKKLNEGELKMMAITNTDSILLNPFNLVKNSNGLQLSFYSPQGLMYGMNYEIQLLRKNPTNEPVVEHSGCEQTSFGNFTCNNNAFISGTKNNFTYTVTRQDQSYGTSCDSRYVEIAVGEIFDKDQPFMVTLKNGTMMYKNIIVYAHNSSIFLYDSDCSADFSLRAGTEYQVEISLFDPSTQKAIPNSNTIKFIFNPYKK